MATNTGAAANDQPHDDGGDLTIYYGAKTYLVHKAVVCPHSDFFKQVCETYPEITTHVIQLPEFYRKTFDLVVEYFYHQDYTVKSAYNSPAEQAASPDEIGIDIPGSSINDAMIHVRVYFMADLFRVQGLKQVAKAYFREVCLGPKSAVWTAQQMIRLAQHVLCLRTEEDTGMCDSIVRLIDARTIDRTSQPEGQRGDFTAEAHEELSRIVTKIAGLWKDRIGSRSQ